MKLCSLYWLLLLLVVEVSGGAGQASASSPEYLNWSPQRTEAIGKSTYVGGKIGGGRGMLSTERALSYKLRATWFTPEVIRATARWDALKHHLTVGETEGLVTAAEAVGDTVVMVELDPNEGSGVIPSDREAYLRPKGTTSPERIIRGVENPELRKVVALQGVMQRNYDYDRLWFVFPLHHEDGKPLFEGSDTELELVVRIYSHEGAVSWVIPSSLRERFAVAPNPALSGRK